MPNLTGVTNFFPTPFENTIPMTLGTSINSGATTVEVSDLSNYSNGQIVVFAIDTGTALQVFTGTVSGSDVVNVIWTEGTNQPHTSGCIIIDLVSATTIGLISAGIQKQHTESGTHIGITNTGGLINSGGLTTDTIDVTSGATLPAGAITPNNLLASTGTSWVWQTWSPTIGGLTIGDGTIVAEYSQTGKTVNFTLLITFGDSTTLPVGADVTFTLPMPPVTSTLSNYAAIGNDVAIASGGALVAAGIVLWHTTSAIGTVFQTTGNGTNPMDTANLTLTTGAALWFGGTYQAA